MCEGAVSRSALESASYLAELKEVRNAAVELIKLEIPYLEKITIDPIAVPVPANAPDLSSKPAAFSAQPSSTSTTSKVGT